MNKQIKGAAFAVCAGAMLIFTGCGGSGTPEEEYAKLSREYNELGCKKNPAFKSMTAADQKAQLDKEIALDLEKFNKMTAEEKKTAIDEMKQMIKMMK